MFPAPQPRKGANRIGRLAYFLQLRLRSLCTGHAFCSKSLLGRSRQPLRARVHCSGILRSNLALEFTARAGFLFWTLCSRSLRGRARSHWAFDRSSCVLIIFRTRFRFPAEILFEIALVPAVHSLELCLVRAHRHRKVSYANPV